MVTALAAVAHVAGVSGKQDRRVEFTGALKLPTMPSLLMHTKHGVVRRRDDGVLDMMVPHMQRGNGGH